VIPVVLRTSFLAAARLRLQGVALATLLLAGNLNLWAVELPVAAQQAFVAKTCAGCHNDKLKSGGFNWSKVDLAHVERSAELTEQAIRMVKAGMMPPPGIPRNPLELKNFGASLEAAIDRAAQQQPWPGSPALHRLNRTEYRNSIRDLLDFDVDAASLLPSDDMSHGFDNMSDVLTVSPALMEGYIRAAGRISREAVGDPHAAAITATYHIQRVENQMRHITGTPFGTRGGMAVTNNFPADGDYVFRLSLYYDICGPLWGMLQGKGQQIEVSVDGVRVAVLNINPDSTFTDDLVSPPVHVPAGPHKVAAAFLSRGEGPVDDSIMPFEQSLINLDNAKTPGFTTLPHLREMRIVGPTKVTGLSETPSRRKIFVCHPASASEEVGCAKQIISRLGRQAFRRPLTDGDVEDLLSVYQKVRNRQTDNDFEAAIRTLVQTLISDPEFIFRFERNPAGAAPGSPYRISDVELASRLSYFLWSSAPDDQLLTVASQGKLKDPVVLEQQVKRMLADRKSEALSQVFASEWLNLQNMKDVQPDAFLFPNFEKNLADSMVHETKMLFDSIVHEDRPVLDLLTANYTFVDEELARHYGIPNVMGERFRRVTLTDPNRFGLLGQGSILTLTSVSNRTSPVQRGKWVMMVLFGTPPPPPPPNVPPLKEAGENEVAHTVREQMEMHRKNEPCASCHKLMDPIGLALENFDAVGQWRTRDAGMPVDTASQMFDGTKLDGPISLRNTVLSHSDAFIGTFTENLTAYGIGRVVDYHDMPMIRSIERDAATRGNKFSAFVLAIVKSMPFQMRQADGQLAPPASPANSPAAKRAQ